MTTTRQKLASDVSPRRVLAVLTLALRICPGLGSAPLAILCNSAGPTIVRHVLGPPHEVESVHGASVVFDPGWTAEAMIWWLMGKRIPTLSDVVSAIRTLPDGVERADADVA